MSQLDTHLTDKVLALLARFDERRVLASKVGVYWNGRMRSAAGRASWPDARIELNPLLKGISEEEVDRTLRHELAHLLVYARYGIRAQPHGTEWQFFCAQLGIPGESATHRLNLPRRTQQKKYVYSCESCGIEFGRVRAITRESACVKCCQAYNGGKFSRKYLLVGRKLG